MKTLRLSARFQEKTQKLIILGVLIMVLGDINNAVLWGMIPEIQKGGLHGLSRTLAILKARADIKTGIAGNDLAITHETRQADGGHYKGFDPARMVSVNEGTVKHFARWSNIYTDAGISGTDLEENLGLTTKELVEDMKSFSELGESNGEIFFSIVQERYEQCLTYLENQWSADLWGLDVPSDDVTVDRRPESLIELFNEEADWHGLAPKELGSFQAGLHPWAQNSPSDLASPMDKYRNVPMVFDRTIGGGTAPELSKEALEMPNIAMSARIPGIWICPLQSEQFAKLAGEFEGHEQGPIVLGYGMWRIGIQSIRYHNTYYYADDYAPADQALHIHIGTDGMGPRSTRRAGFRLCCWMSKKQMEDYEAIRMKMLSLPSLADSDAILGADMSMPIWNAGWWRNPVGVDSLIDRLFMKYTFVGPERFYNFKVRIAV